MNRPKLGELETRVMKEVWRLGRASVHDVREALAARKRRLAYTTVLTTLRNLEEKGYLDHDLVGRSHVYFATVAEKVAARRVLGDLLERLFDGSRVRLVDALLEEGQLSKREFEELRKQVIELRRREEGGDD